nr:sn1-specific diacylglycerol lipase beta [Ipomoea batatas]
MIIVLGISVVMAAGGQSWPTIAAISAIGLALLHRYSLSSKLAEEEPLPVPEEMIVKHEAALFHPFVEAAFITDKFKKQHTSLLFLPHLKTVVIVVRGTETPEDLITVGLHAGNGNLSEGDLDGT